MRLYPGAFSETLVQLMKEKKLSNKKLADASLVGERTIQRLRNEEEYPTTVQTVLGLCYGLQKPLIAVGSLDALTEVAREDYEAGILSVSDWDRALLCPMVDARRMEVYAQVFDAEGRPQNEVTAEVIDAGSFREFREQGRPFVIFGSGARKCADVLAGAGFVEVAPSARGLARLAQQALDEGRTEDIAYFEPFYLKDFVVTTSKKSLF